MRTRSARRTLFSRRLTVGWLAKSGPDIGNGMVNIAQVTGVTNGSGYGGNYTNLLLGLPEQKRPGIRGNFAAIKIGFNFFV